MLITILLSSRTHDEVTGPAAERLLSRAPTPDDLLRLDPEEVQHLIYPVGFYRQKAIHILEIARILTIQKEVPADFSRLTSLPGVGRKTANLVLSLAFGIPAIAVDTHVFRISRRLGWAFSQTPDEVEEELKVLFPKADWISINQVLVGFGQTICRPLRPRCSNCLVAACCPYFRSGPVW